jgi:hypothetical protein
MKSIDKSIFQVIEALMELEAKGCHSVFFEYGNSLFSVRIFRGEVKVENIVFEKTINTIEEQPKLDEITKHVKDMRLYVVNTHFQCFRQEFVKGEKSGKWEKIKPSFVVGENATQEMLIDGSGYYINDPDNNLLYFVDMKQESDIN